MTNGQILNLIEKCIIKTKNHTLHWESLSGNSSLMKKRPLPASIISFLDEDLNDSYYAKFNDGFLFIVATRSNLSIIPNCDLSGRPLPKSLSFRVQPSPYSYYSELVNTDESDSDISIQLRRLHTIIENSGSDIDAFLDDFLNS